MSRPADIQSDCDFSVQKDVLQYFFDRVSCYSCHSNPFGLKLFLKRHVVLL